MQSLGEVCRAKPPEAVVKIHADILCTVNISINRTCIILGCRIVINYNYLHILYININMTTYMHIKCIRDQLIIFHFSLSGSSGS